RARHCGSPLTTPRCARTHEGTERGARLAQLPHGTSECLAAREHGLEQVAMQFDPRERLPNPEAAWREVLCQLVPEKRRRDGCTGLRPHRVDRSDRLPPGVLA